jgi:hypothetical protein
MDSIKNTIININNITRMNIIFVHGFNDPSEGSKNIDLLAPYAKKKGYGVKTKDMDYGWRFFLGVRFQNKDTAKRLIDLYQEGDIVVGYSNGCDIISIAIEMGLPAKHCIFIHPALRADWSPPANSPVLWIDVYYSENDNATKAAGVLRRYSPLNMLFGRSRLGKMGTVGPTSLNPVFRRHDDGCDHYDWASNPELYLHTVKEIGND